MLGWRGQGWGGGGWLGKHLHRRDDLYHLRFQPNWNSKLQGFFWEKVPNGMGVVGRHMIPLTWTSHGTAVVWFRIHTNVATLPAWLPRWCSSYHARVLTGRRRFDSGSRQRKSSYAMCACRLFSRGLIFTRARVSLALLSLRKKGDYS